MAMELNREKEEYLEILWYMRETGSTSLQDFKKEIGDRYQQNFIDDLLQVNAISLKGSRIALIGGGVDYARQLIRSHRLAERLVHDVLGAASETGACEFEHIINKDLVDSICTMLGHPRQCPHGMLIPEGECCKQESQVVESTVVSLCQLDVGQEARVAYVYAKDDRQMHRLDNLLLRPGVDIRLHQRKPAFVVECENSMIALDEKVAANVHVWTRKDQIRTVKPIGRRRERRGFRRGIS